MTNKQALREKFEAWAEEAGALPWGILEKHRNQDGSYPGPHYTYMWHAWSASHEAMLDELEAAEKRVTELEAREVTLPKVQDIHPLGPQSAKVICEFHRNIVNRCADEIRKIGVKVSIKGD